MQLVIVPYFHRGTSHVICGELFMQLGQLQLMEGQDLALSMAEELLASSIWSIKLGSHRPLVDGLREVMQHVLTQLT